MSTELPPPSNPGATKARRITPQLQELPAMPPPTMSPMLIIVAWNRQRKQWLIADTSETDFEADSVVKRLPPTHWQHARVYKLSDQA